MVKKKLTYMVLKVVYGAQICVVFILNVTLKETNQHEQ